MRGSGQWGRVAYQVRAGVGVDPSGPGQQVMRFPEKGSFTGRAPELTPPGSIPEQSKGHGFSEGAVNGSQECR